MRNPFSGRKPPLRTGAWLLGAGVLNSVGMILSLAYAVHPTKKIPQMLQYFSAGFHLFKLRCRKLTASTFFTPQYHKLLVSVTTSVFLLSIPLEPLASGRISKGKTTRTTSHLPIRLCTESHAGHSFGRQQKMTTSYCVEFLRTH